MGGEYGGAATYVAEHSPEGKRGYYTSWIQTTATLGLFVSLGVILITRSTLTEEQYKDWGWRLPFLVSIVLVIVSIFIRMRMKESPLFSKLKEEGKTSVNPLKESFGHKTNLKMVLLALFGATMGQGVVWYTGQFYAQTFLLKTCSLNDVQANTWIGLALLFATPFFVVFGALSDKIGRKPIIITGMLLAILCYRPIFKGMYALTDIKQKTEVQASADKMISEKTDDKDKSKLLVTTTTTKVFTDGSSYKEAKTETVSVATHAPVDAKAKPVIKKTITLGESYKWKIVGYIFILVIFVTMVYGPIAAFLVELFPTKIRYTSMSLPYHIGNGVFGGLVPFIGTLMFEYSKTPANPTGDILAGLWYPIIIAGLCAVIGILYLDNRKVSGEW